MGKAGTRRLLAKRLVKRMGLARADEGDWSRNRSGQAEDEVGREGARSGRAIAVDIEAKPNKPTDAAQAYLFWSQASRVAGSDARHFGEIVYRPEFHIVRTRHLAHGLKLAGNAFAPSYTRLGAAIENLFDSEQAGVVDAFAKGQIEGVGRSDIIERQHLESLEDGKRDVAERLKGREIEGRGYGTSPLQGESSSHFLFCGEAQFFDPLADFSVKKRRRGPADARDRLPGRAVLEPDPVALEKKRT